MDLKLDQLKDYNHWIGKSPADVLRSVKKLLGGWGSVFPRQDGPMPLWAHKVRNYFNEAPIWLKRWDEDRASNWLEPIYRTLDVTYYYREAWGLSDDVYQDDAGRVWLQMSAAATIYHYPDGLLSGTPKGLKNAVDGQSSVPVFKLVSTDSTGGSRECVIVSARSRYLPGPYETVLGEENEMVPVTPRIVIDQEYQGSYNYSETMERGLVAHEFHDVEPHNRDPIGYVNPPPYSALFGRRFPQFDNQGYALAHQIHRQK